MAGKIGSERTASSHLDRLHAAQKKNAKRSIHSKLSKPKI